MVGRGAPEQFETDVDVERQCGAGPTAPPMTSTLPQLDPIFHQQVRTRLAVLLRWGEISFAELKTSLQITDGNLDAHMKKLTAAGYVHSRMVLEGRPHTRYQLSPSGKEAFDSYAAALRVVLDKGIETNGQ